MRVVVTREKLLSELGRDKSGPYSVLHLASYLKAEVDVLSGSQEQIDRQQSTNQACQDREQDSEADRRIKLLFVDSTTILSSQFTISIPYRFEHVVDRILCPCLIPLADVRQGEGCRTLALLCR